MQSNAAGAQYAAGSASTAEHPQTTNRRAQHQAAWLRISKDWLEPGTAWFKRMRPQRVLHGPAFQTLARACTATTLAGRGLE